MSKMCKIAIILTVYNRCTVTIKGLKSLYKAIDFVGKDYSFDVYMTDDGSSDGTSEAVHNIFPDITIIPGDGNLYWCGGMRKSWQAAIDSGTFYDYFLWFNDDADLYEDALETVFFSEKVANGNSIISGAFHDDKGCLSYSGYDTKGNRVAPSGQVQPLKMIHGNLVLIPNYVVDRIGIIDECFQHFWGDVDYGLRAEKSGINVFLATKYVGVTNRHDYDSVNYADYKYGLITRWKMLHNVKNSPKTEFIFNRRRFGLCRATVSLITKYVYVFIPFVYRIRKEIQYRSGN